MASRLLAVEVDNYRCLVRARIEPAGLRTVLVGANATGKSAFLDAIALVADLIAAPTRAWSREWRGVFGPADPTALEDALRDPAQPMRVMLEFEVGDRRYRYTLALRSERRAAVRVHTELLERLGPAVTTILQQDASGARAGRGENADLTPESATRDVPLLVRCDDPTIYPALQAPLRYLQNIQLLRLTPLLMRGATPLEERPDRYGRDLSARVHAFAAGRPTRVADVLDQVLGPMLDWEDLTVDVRAGGVGSFRELHGGRAIRLAQASDGSLVQLYLSMLAYDPPDPQPSLYLFDEFAQHYLPRAEQMATNLVKAMGIQAVLATHSPGAVAALATLRDVWVFERRGGEAARITRLGEQPEIQASIDEVGLGEAAFARLDTFQHTPQG